MTIACFFFFGSIFQYQRYYIIAGKKIVWFEELLISNTRCMSYKKRWKKLTGLSKLISFKRIPQIRDGCQITKILRKSLKTENSGEKWRKVIKGVSLKDSNQIKAASIQKNSKKIRIFFFYFFWIFFSIFTT